MLWPETAKRDAQGQLWIGGAAAGELAHEFGTPLYVFDEATIRAQCRRYAGALGAEHPRGQVAYAGKAGLNWALLQIIREEGLALDVVSAGELQLALWAGFPPERIHLHGNNKSPDELALALEAGIGRSRCSQARRRSSSTSPSVESGTRAASAAASRDTSSSVGPSPPLATTMA